MTAPEITLNEVKQHCRLELDMTEEDALLQMYIAAALEVCQTHIGKRFDVELVFTPAIKVGCLMYISHLYENRSMIDEVEKVEVPLAISALWSAYRDLGVC